jgi:AcrR family transcriptional regulator
MPAPRKFTEEQLRTTALAIVDEEGLAALTMRRLAEALGTGAMTVYNYVDGRDGLEALIVGAVMAEVPVPGKPGRKWDEDVRATATALWRTIRSHPNVIPLILGRRTDDPATLAAAEVLLEALARGGRSGFDLLAAFRVVSGFVAGFAQSEVAGLLKRSAGSKDVLYRLRAASQGRHPRLAEIAAVGVPGDAEREFQAGLDIILAGLANAPARRATKARSTK